MKQKHAFSALVATALFTSAINAHAQMPQWDTFLLQPDVENVGYAVLIDPFSADPNNPAIFIGCAGGSILRAEPAAYGAVVVDNNLEQVNRFAYHPTNLAFYAVGQAWQATSKRGGHNVWRVRKSTYDLNHGWGAWTDLGGDTFALSTSEDARARGCAVDAQGNVYVSGMANLNNTSHWIVRKLPVVVGGVWQTVSDLGATAGLASAGGMCFFPGLVSATKTLNPAVFVVGTMNGKGAVQRLGPNGTWNMVDIWSRSTYTGANNISYDQAGNLYAVGYVADSGGLAYGWIVRKSEDGGVNWTTVLDVAEGYNSGASAVAADISGNVWVAGFTGSTSNLKTSQPKWTVVKHSTESWSESWANHEDQFLLTSTWARPYAFATDASGNVFITGIVQNWTDGVSTLPGSRVVVQRLIPAP